MLNAAEGRLTGIINLVRQRLASTWRHAKNLNEIDGTEVYINITPAVIATAIRDNLSEELYFIAHKEEKTGMLLGLMQLEIPETAETEIEIEFCVDEHSAYEYAMEKLERHIDDWVSRIDMSFSQGDVMAHFSGEREIGGVNDKGVWEWNPSIQKGMETFYWQG